MASKKKKKTRKIPKVSAGVREAGRRRAVNRILKQGDKPFQTKGEKLTKAERAKVAKNTGKQIDRMTAIQHAGKKKKKKKSKK